MEHGLPAKCRHGPQRDCQRRIDREPLSVLLRTCTIYVCGSVFRFYFFCCTVAPISVLGTTARRPTCDELQVELSPSTHQPSTPSCLQPAVHRRRSNAWPAELALEHRPRAHLAYRDLLLGRAGKAKLSPPSKLPIGDRGSQSPWLETPLNVSIEREEGVSREREGLRDTACR